MIGYKIDEIDAIGPNIDKIGVEKEIFQIGK